MLTSTQAANSTEPVTLAGKAYPVRQLKFHEWADLQSWLKSVCPNPLAVAAKALSELRAQGAPIDPIVQKAMFEQAQEESRRWPPKIGSGAWLRALEDIEGGRGRFLQVALEAGGTELSDEEADDVVERATLEELGELMRVCLFGEPPHPKRTTTLTDPTTELNPMNGESSSSSSAKSDQAGPIETLPN